MATATSAPPESSKIATASQMVMGPAGPVHDGVRRMAQTLPSYLFVALLLEICTAMGFVQPWQSACVLAYNVVGLGIFYALVRSGVAARAKEPTLAFPQVLFNASMVMLAYALIPLARGLALQWLCMIILFDMRRLSAAQVRLAAFSAYALLLGTVYAILKIAPDSIDMGAEFVNVAMASLTLCILLVVTTIGQRVNAHRKQQRKELERTVKQLNALSIRDGLTQLFNRRHVQTLLDEEIRRSHRCGRHFCVAILDIDFFKRVNDQHGHAMGDTVLQDVSSVAQATLGPTQSLARWGGEEFLLLMPETTLPEAMAAVERVRRAVREHDWDRHVPGLKVSLSAGVCAHDGMPQATPTLERADRALYEAKHAGRDRVVAAEPMITVLAASS
jgi:diguanylate cyclase (GGDEF)-like protein